MPPTTSPPKNSPASKRRGDVDPAKRLKIIVLSTLIVILSVWVGIFLVPLMIPKPVAKEPESAGWVIARELNQALVAEKAYADTSLTVTSEEPLKFKVQGMVRTQQDIIKLREFLTLKKPEVSPQQYEFDIEVRR